MSQSETKWTPGASPYQLAYLARHPRVDWPLEANARLIAAAPELYEALLADEALIQHAQAILTEYLIPDGMTGEETLNQLLALLDGPDQRAAAKLASVALAKADGRK